MKKLIFYILLFISFSFTSCATKNIAKFHFIDIGQGDASLIQFNNINILIDTGPNSSEEDLLDYLKHNNIYTIDYLIATHPHEDHIGNVDSILKEFKVEEILAPKAIYESDDFFDMMKSIKKAKLSITPINENTDDIVLSSDFYIDFLSPSKSNYENLNNYSPMIKITYKNTSFLFTGDAEHEAETEVLNKDIDSDVLKVGHHGSSSSSSPNFLSAVSPNISVISCGIQNQFSHPHKSIIDNLNSVNSKIYRTDEDGTILITSDGESLNIKK